MYHHVNINDYQYCKKSLFPQTLLYFGCFPTHNLVPHSCSQGLCVSLYASPVWAWGWWSRDLCRWSPSWGSVQAARAHPYWCHVTNKKKGKYKQPETRVWRAWRRYKYLMPELRVAGAGVWACERPVVDALDGRAGGEQKGCSSGCRGRPKDSFIRNSCWYTAKHSYPR